MDQKRNIVVGGGSVAYRKIESLLKAGAQVTVISPELCPALADLAREQAGIQVIDRPYQTGDLEAAFLVIAATDDPHTNQAVWHEAVQRGCLVNVVDDPAHCNFIVPAVVQRGELSIAITTGGSSPALARRLRQKIEAEIGPEYGLLAEILAELRPELVTRFPPGEPRLQAALNLIDSDLLEILRSRGKQAAIQYARRVWDRLTDPSPTPPPAL